MVRQGIAPCQMEMKRAERSPLFADRAKIMINPADFCSRPKRESRKIFTVCLSGHQNFLIGRVRRGGIFGLESSLHSRSGRGTWDKIFPQAQPQGARILKDIAPKRSNSPQPSRDSAPLSLNGDQGRSGKDAGSPVSSAISESARSMTGSRPDK